MQRLTSRRHFPKADNARLSNRQHAHEAGALLLN
jgi:hypothetical protein